MPTPNQIDTPAYLHGAYGVMQVRWQLCQAVYGGTEALRARYKDFLWQSVAETDEELAKRAGQLEVFPAFKQTVDGLTGVAFRVEPQFGTDVPQLIVDHAENIDGQGTHLTVFLKELFRDALKEGHQGIFIDLPPAVDKEGQALYATAGQELRAGLRPIWLRIYPENILSWRVGLRDGRVILTQLVIRETSEEPTGLFACEDMTRYRKYRIEENGQISFRIWTEDMVQNWNAGSYANPETFGFITNQVEIPFVVIYGGPRVGPLVSIPPLLDLAHANVSHTNVVSDHRNGLHSAMHPILVVKGRQRRARDVTAAAAQGEDDSIQIGPGVGIDLPAVPEADVKYVEHEGKALGAGRDEIKDIEKRMAAMGLAMLQNDTRAAETAEAKRIDKDEKTANLTSAVRSLQDGAELAMEYHANYLRLPTGGSLNVNKDFETRPLEPLMVTALSNMVGTGQLSLETLWEIMQKQELLPEEFTSEDELARIVAGGMIPGTGPTPPEPAPAPGAPNPGGGA